MDNATTRHTILLPEDMDSVTNTELAACLVTLGFELIAAHRLTGYGIDSSAGRVSWRFAVVSQDGKYQLADVMRRWEDKAWLTDPQNTDPLAYVICAFHNRRKLIDQVKQGAELSVIDYGARRVLISTAASREQIRRAEKFLLTGGV